MNESMKGIRLVDDNTIIDYFNSIYEQLEYILRIEDYIKGKFNHSRSSKKKTSRP